MSKALHSAASVEHYTPLPIVESARTVLGGIDLDPASCAFAQRDIQAAAYYDGGARGDGLSQPWRGKVFVNPPGKSKSNPGGAAAWWAKAVREWQVIAGDGEVSNIIFVGFSLELLQTAQSVVSPLYHPLTFPHCVPSKRLAFDVEADALIAKLTDELRTAPVSRVPAIVRRLEKLDALRGQRAPGTSPTHGNIIVLLTSDKAMVGRFMAEFKQYGFCGGGVL